LNGKSEEPYKHIHSWKGRTIYVVTHENGAIEMRTAITGGKEEVENTPPRRPHKGIGNGKGYSSGLLQKGKRAKEPTSYGKSSMKFV